MSPLNTSFTVFAAFLIQSSTAKETKQKKPMKIDIEISKCCKFQANPDGYENSRKPGKRFWRKNMSPAPPGSNCPGVDLNRNVAFPPEAYGVGASHGRILRLHTISLIEKMA